MKVHQIRYFLVFTAIAIINLVATVNVLAQSKIAESKLKLSIDSIDVIAKTDLARAKKNGERCALLSAQNGFSKHEG